VARKKYQEGNITRGISGEVPENEHQENQAFRPPSRGKINP
jgi:hypothetical protein